MLFANLVGMSSLSFKLLIKNNVGCAEIEERALKQASPTAFHWRTVFPMTQVQSSWGKLLGQLKIFYYPVHIFILLSYERFHGGLF